MRLSKAKLFLLSSCLFAAKGIFAHGDHGQSWSSSASSAVAEVSARPLEYDVTRKILDDPFLEPDLPAADEEVAVATIQGIVRDLPPPEPEPHDHDHEHEEEIEEADPETTEQLEELSDLTRWLAMQQLDGDPDNAINSLLVSAAAARYAGLQPSLWSFLEGIKLENKTLAALARIAPKLNAEQRKQLFERFKALPKANSLKEALETEKILMLQEERTRIHTAVQQWRAEHLDDGVLPFPDNMRIAGVVLRPDKPVRINLHNIVSGGTFWIEEGETLHGIFCEKVNRKTFRAWIIKDGAYAQVDLRSELITARSVPWDVIFDLYGIDSSGMSDQEIADQKKLLSEIGISPKSLLGNLDAIETFYVELAEQLDASPDELEAWADSKLEAVPDGLPQKEVLEVLPGLVKVETHAQLEAGAFEAGMNYLETVIESDEPLAEIEVGDITFIIQNDDSGFTVAPKEQVTEDPEQWIGIRFGDEPIEVSESTNL